jgi:hypothetical protein
MKAKRFLFIPLLILVVNGIFVLSVFGDSRVPGVVPGQFLHFSNNLIVTGNDTGLMSYIIPDQSWLNITVLSTSGINVTSQQVFYNETTVRANSTIFLNIETAEVHTINGTGTYYVFATAANLSTGDLIYLSGSMTINETIISNEYLGRQLEINHCLSTINLTNTNQYGYTVNLTGTNQFYYDKGNGICLDLHSNFSYSRSDGVGGILVTHREGRMLILEAIPPIPPIPEFPLLLILPLLMLATLLAVIVYKRKHT